MYRVAIWQDVLENATTEEVSFMYGKRKEEKGKRRKDKFQKE